MFKITPASEGDFPSPPFFKYCNAALHIVNVPTESISNTVRKPFGDKSSAAQRKLPAAPFTRISSLPNCFTVTSTTRATSSILRTSPSIPMARMPGAWSAAVASSTTVFTEDQKHIAAKSTNYIDKSISRAVIVCHILNWTKLPNFNVVSMISYINSISLYNCTRTII